MVRFLKIPQKTTDTAMIAFKLTLRRFPVARLSSALICAMAPTAAALLLSSCTSRGILTTLGPDAPAPEKPAATVWQAPPVQQTAQPLEASGQSVAKTATVLDFKDPVLAELIDRAVAVSGDIAQTSSRFAQARTALAASDSQALPSLTGIAEFTRTAFTFGGPVLYRSQVSAGAQASWEIDLFGGLARARQAAQARLQAAALRVSAVKVSVTAETANAYVMLRLCEQEAQALSGSVTSLKRSDAAVRAAAAVGVINQVDVTRIGIQMLDAQTAAEQKSAQCGKLLKTLVALTGFTESELRTRLQERHAIVPVPQAFAIDGIPARVLENRADIAAAQYDVAAASADVGVALAERYPTLSLTGNLLPSRVSINSGPTLSVTTWAISPALRLPIFDAGRRRMAAQAAQIEYESAAVQLRERVRVAVSEVEQSLVDINALAQTVQQQGDALKLAQEQLRLMSLRRQQGFSSGLDEETSRRQVLSTQTQSAQQTAQYAMAWVGLYRAAGGDWNANAKAER